MKTYQSTNSDYAKSLDTRALRKQFLVQEIFSADELVLNYSHTDRILIGGAMPVAGDVRIGEELAKMVGTDYLLKRRELGAINIGGDGSVCIDGESLRVAANEGIYIGCGNRDVRFSSDDAQAPAKFYINCAPAHTEYPSRTITQQQASPETLGSTKTSNARTIYKYIVPDVLPTCQLLMGLTRLETGSLWNTMPCHRHERRMEVYFYFDMDEDSVVFHFMGEPSETRHLVVRNEEAVIAPSWSLHTGVGTSKYTFIWGMVGENQEFSDMDFVAMSELL